MFNIFKKKEVEGNIVRFKIKGMHCVSCSMNIDGALEETEGITKSKTSYAKGETAVFFDPLKIDVGEIAAIINKQGYKSNLVV